MPTVALTICAYMHTYIYTNAVYAPPPPPPRLLDRRVGRPPDDQHRDGRDAHGDAEDGAAGLGAIQIPDGGDGQGEGHAAAEAWGVGGWGYGINYISIYY